MRTEGVVFWLVAFALFMLWLSSRGPARAARWAASLPYRLFIGRRRRR
jgi:hypothetical protein